MRLTDGGETYPHRPDLANIPFWKCDTCNNFVGCHHKTKNRTKPLGIIPTPELKKARQGIHWMLDPIWKTGRLSRSELYQRIAMEIGCKEYHTANVASIAEAEKVLAVITKIKSGVS